jgi:hypothetical protein
MFPMRASAWRRKKQSTKPRRSWNKNTRPRYPAMTQELLTEISEL